MPFTAFFPAGVADPTLIDRLTRPEALQGLLRTAVGGLQSVMRRGAFITPASVEKATRRFREEADPVRGFIRERIRQADGYALTDRTHIYNSYVAWSTVNGFHQMSAARFYESFNSAVLETHSVKVTINRGIRGYRGITLS